MKNMKEKTIVKENKTNRLLLFMNMFWKEDTVEGSVEDEINKDETLSIEQKEELKKTLKRVEKEAKRFDVPNKKTKKRTTRKIEINNVEEKSAEKEKMETVKSVKGEEREQ